VVSLHRQAPVDAKVLAYLNRLSDFLFMAARVSNLREQVPEHVWEAARRQT
jgi:cob(I)alamin adenosyltransferase